MNKQLCAGKTNKGVPCHYKVRTPHIYCKRHQPMDEKKKEKKKEKKEEKKEERKVSEESTCSICLMSVTDNDVILTCSHVHHQECLQQLHKNECPVCRKPLDFGKGVDINLGEIEERHQRDLLLQQQEDERRSIQLARQMVNPLGSLIQQAIVASMESLDFDEYEQTAQVLEESDREEVERLWNIISSMPNIGIPDHLFDGRDSAVIWLRRVDEQ